MTKTNARLQSWGYFATVVPGQETSFTPYASAQVSASPFIAGKLWVLPQNLESGCGSFCSNLYIYTPVRWSDITASLACANSSQPIYKYWSGPNAFGYCDGVGANAHFTAPIQPIAAGGLIVAACVLYIVTAATSTMHPCYPSNKQLMACLAFFNFVAWILTVAAWASWLDFTWARKAQSQSGTFMPAWIFPAALQTPALFPVPVLCVVFLRVFDVSLN